MSSKPSQKASGATKKETQKKTGDAKNEPQKQTVSNNADNSHYFNQYSSGIAYVNALKEFKASDGSLRYGVKLAVLQGPVDNVHYEYHDLIITSEVTLNALLAQKEDINNEDVKVIAHFNMSNPRSKSFIYKSGKKVGQIGTSIGGFLTRIFYLKVDGNEVYKDERIFDDAETVTSDEPPNWSEIDGEEILF
ncbi:DUF3577 domain-containing protein [Porticoccus sp. GXU_MW_L64]